MRSYVVTCVASYTHLITNREGLLKFLFFLIHKRHLVLRGTYLCTTRERESGRAGGRESARAKESYKALNSHMERASERVIKNLHMVDAC